MIRPEEFGATGNGRTDDAPAIQAALDHAGAGPVLLGAGRYRVGATILVPSGATLLGEGCTLDCTGGTGPALASAPWARSGAPLRGRTRLRGLRVQFTDPGPRRDGIVLHDFWSSLEGCEVVAPSGRGIVLTATDRAGTPAGGTLVENRIRDCVVRDAGDTAFALGEPANGKLTDGTLEGCVASLRDGVSAPAVTVGHAAGWTVRDLHTYGGHPDIAVELRQGFFTRVSGLYVETFERFGLALPAMQTSVTVSDAQIATRRPRAGAAYLTVSAHRDYPGPLLSLANVALFAEERGEGGDALLNDGGQVRVEGMPPVRFGPGFANSGQGQADAAQPSAPGRRVVGFAGRDAQRLVVARAPGDGAFAQGVLVTIAGRSPDGGLASVFTGSLTWTRAATHAEAVLVDLVPFGAPFGFRQLPVATFERDGEGFALTLSFATLSSGPGQVTIA